MPNVRTHLSPRRGVLGLALALLCAPAAFAGTVVLENARVIDGTGAAPVPATIVIENARIASVTSHTPDDLPDDAQRIDLAGRTVMPGLISNHSHVGITDGVQVSAANYNRGNIERQLRQFQRYGVTTVTSLGMNGALFGTLRDEAHAGIGAGADLFGADKGIGVPGAAPPVPMSDDQLHRPVDADAARAAVREMAARKPDLVKVWVDDFYHSLGRKMAPEVYTAVIEEAHALGLRVAAHVYYLDDAKHLVAAGVDVIAHGIRDQPVDEAVIALMRRHGTWYIPTLDLDESFFGFATSRAWQDSDFLGEALQPALAAQMADGDWRARVTGDAARVARWHADVRMNQLNLKRLFDAGVRIGFGTDSGATPLRVIGVAEHRELQLMVEAGLTPLQAISIATANAAQLLALDDRGVIAAGRRADLLVIDGDPARDIADSTHIKAVWQGGRQVSGAIFWAAGSEGHQERAAVEK